MAPPNTNPGQGTRRIEIEHSFQYEEMRDEGLKIIASVYKYAASIENPDLQKDLIGGLAAEFTRYSSGAAASASKAVARVAALRAHDAPTDNEDNDDNDYPTASEAIITRHRRTKSEIEHETKLAKFRVAEMPSVHPHWPAHVIEQSAKKMVADLIGKPLVAKQDGKVVITDLMAARYVHTIYVTCILELPARLGKIWYASQSLQENQAEREKHENCPRELAALYNSHHLSVELEHNRGPLALIRQIDAIKTFSDKIKELRLRAANRTIPSAAAKYIREQINLRPGAPIQDRDITAFAKTVAPESHRCLSWVSVRDNFKLIDMLIEECGRGFVALMGVKPSTFRNKMGISGSNSQIIFKAIKKNTELDGILSHLSHVCHSHIVKPIVNKQATTVRIGGVEYGTDLEDVSRIRDLDLTEPITEL